MCPGSSPGVPQSAGESWWESQVLTEEGCLQEACRKQGSQSVERLSCGPGLAGLVECLPLTFQNG